MPKKLQNLPQKPAEYAHMVITTRGQKRVIPRSPYLQEQILLALCFRFQTSSSNEDQQTLRWIKMIAGLEETIELAGEDVISNGKHFSEPLRAIGAGRFESGQVKHDRMTIRNQYTFLKAFAIAQGLPVRPEPPEITNWLTREWRTLDLALRRYPCRCEYGDPESTWPDISGCNTQKGLLVCIMAHLHDSTVQGIDRYLK